MILGKSETVRITIRDTKDCFYLYNVPPSRVMKQVDTEIGSWVSQDLLKNARIRRICL